MSDKNKLKPESGAVMDESEQLGKVLAAGLKKIGEPGPCLSEEDIAALVEGTVSGEEKDRMMKHLAVCETCHDVYSFTLGMVVEEEEEKRKEKFKIIRFKPLALAASILIVIVSIYVFYRTESIPKTTGELLKMEEAAPLSSYAPTEKPSGKNEDKKILAPMKEKRDRRERKGAKAAPKDEEQKQTEETQLKDEDESGKAMSVTVPATVPGTQQPMTQKLEAARSNVMVEKEKAYIPDAELEKLFKETYEITNKANSNLEDYRLDRVNMVGSSKKRDTSGGVSPLVTMVSGDKGSKMLPNMSYFLSKSAPGTVENRFFKLAAIGWSDAQGNYNGAGNTNVELVKQWEALYPTLKGIYKEIAANTIVYLKKNPR